MSTAVTARSNGGGQITTRFSPDQVDLIKRTICKNATDDELRLFMYQADKTGLDPLARQIYAVKRWDSVQRREVMAIQTSIDGFRLIAERTGKYAGQVGPFWCGADGQWQDVWVGDEAPIAARIGVLRTDFKEPCFGVARFKSYAQTNKEGKPTRMWVTMPDVMLAKCAEALALRKAFPQELSGVYTGDEMQQATEADAPAHTAPKPETAQIAKPAPLPPHDPETGEILDEGIPPFLDRRPATKPAPIDADDWIKFGEKYIAAVKGCKSLSEANDWYSVNQSKIDQMRHDAPKVYARLSTAVAKLRAAIATDADMADVGAPPNDGGVTWRPREYSTLARVRCSRTTSAPAPSWRRSAPVTRCC